MDLAWGAPRDLAVAKLSAALGSSAHLQPISLPDGRSVELAVLSGTVQGFEECAILAFFTEGRLTGLEIVIPPQRTGGAAGLFRDVYLRQLENEEAQRYNVGFTLRRAEDVQVDLNGEMCTPEIVTMFLNPENDLVNRGLLKAEGFLLFKNGGLIRMQTTSAGFERKNPLYKLGCLVVNLKSFGPDAIQEAESHPPREPEAPKRPPVDSVEEDFLPDAFKLLRAQAERGDLAAQKRLASLYVRGGDVPPDRAEAIKWGERALAQGDASMAFPLATLYANRWYTFYPPSTGPSTPEDYARAAALYEQAGKAGNAQALVQLARMYADGQGVEKDPAACRRLMEQAARLGDPEAYYELAKLDPDQSLIYSGRVLTYVQEAARRGHVFAAHELARQYLAPPRGGPPDYPEGIRWLKYAAICSQNYDRNISSDARADLSDLYAAGLGVTRDPVEALVWKLLQQACLPERMRGELEPALGKLRQGMAEPAIAEAQSRAQAWLKAHPHTQDDAYPFE